MLPPNKIVDGATSPRDRQAEADERAGKDAWREYFGQRCKKGLGKASKLLYKWNDSNIRRQYRPHSRRKPKETKTLFRGV